MAVAARSISGLGGLCLVQDWDERMAVKKSAEPSPESTARANRQRLASEDGAQAMAEIEQKAVAVRKNMERLRALRESKEAEEARTQPAIPAAIKKNRKKGLPK